MAIIAHILYFKLLSFIKLNVDWRFENVVRNVGSFLVYAGFAIGAYFFTQGMISFLLERINIGTFLLHRFLSMLLYVFFLSINVGNIIVAYAALYKSREVSYFLTLPIPHVSLFVIKFLDNFFYSSTTLSLIGLAVLLGYGSYFQLPLPFYIAAVVFLFLPFMLLAASLGVMTLMVLIGLAAKMGVRLIIAGVSVVYLTSVYAFFKMTSPMKLVNEVMRYYPNIDGYFGFLDPPFFKLLPNHWVAESLYWISAGNYSAAIPHVLMLVGSCVLFSAAAILIARRWYYRSWMASLELAPQKIRAHRQHGWFQFDKKSSLEPQIEVMIKKELWQFLREPSQWIHLSVILFLIAIFLASIVRIEIVHSLPILHTGAYLIVFIFNAFLVCSIALRFVYPMISIEGEAFWKIRSAPIRLRKIAAVKFAIAFLLTAAIGFVLNAFSHLSAEIAAPLFVSSSLNALSITVAMVGLCFGMGSFFATFKERNPIRIASSQGASLTFLMSLLYLVFLVAALFLPVSTYFEQLMRGRVDASGICTAVVVIGTISGLIAAASYLIGLRSLHRDF